MPRPIRKILVPIDFSPGSERAMLEAISIADQLGARLLAIHVHQIQSYMGPDLPGAGALMVEPLNVTMAKEAEEVAARLSRFMYGLTNRDIADIEIVEGFGEPSKAIIDLARERDVDMIVMGTHGRTGLSHLFLGSVAERVVREAPCPVLTVRIGAEQKAA